MANRSVVVLNNIGQTRDGQTGNPTVNGDPGQSDREPHCKRRPVAVRPGTPPYPETRGSQTGNPTVNGDPGAV